jgi:hypothetical protein
LNAVNTVAASMALPAFGARMASSVWRSVTRACLLALSFSSAASAQTPWPPELSRHFTTQCRVGLVAQGLGNTKATEICECMAVGLSREFGMEGYEHMQTAQLNARGSFHDRRFHAVASSCYHPVYRRF